MKSQLIELSHDLGAEHRELAILGEGNTSVKLSDDTFLVKASGSTLSTLDESGIVECRYGPLLAMLDGGALSDEQIEEQILASRVDPASRKPSVESLFHAYLLTLTGIRFVGHVHPIALNQILCSPHARDFAGRRLFPDHIVCCGADSVLIPYVDPGLQLARVIRDAVTRYLGEHGEPPRVILLQNHGVIALGTTPDAVKAALYMTDKAARIFAGAMALGGPTFLDAPQVDRIANRIDEHHRRRALNL